MPYVSITGLKLRGRRHLVRFWWHGLRSMAQARKAPGNRGADARIIDGVHHTLTLWDDEQAMRTYLRGGSHLQAMRAFRSIATGSTIGFVADAAPTWREAREIWEARGREV